MKSENVIEFDAWGHSERLPGHPDLIGPLASQAASPEGPAEAGPPPIRPLCPAPSPLLPTLWAILLTLPRAGSVQPSASSSSVERDRRQAVPSPRAADEPQVVRINLLASRVTPAMGDTIGSGMINRCGYFTPTARKSLGNYVRALQ